jgi:hypothetical protein
VIQMTNSISASVREGEPERADERRLTRPDEIETFLRLYDDALEICNAKIGLFSLPGAATFASRDQAALTRRAAALSSAQKQVYFHIHLHDLPEGGAAHRGSVDSMRAAIGLFADIDARGPGRKKPAETLCPSVHDAIALVEEFNRQFRPLRTSLIIRSGHGCYPVILLKEPLLVTERKHRELLESLSRRFHHALHQIATRRGWSGAVDYCDVARVLRLPGCTNWKDLNNPKPVYITHCDEARFNLGELEDLLPQVTATNRPANLSNAGFCQERRPDVALKLTGEVPEELLTALTANVPLFAATWDHRRIDLKDQSCSGYDMALAAIAIASGLTDQQVADLIVLSRHRFPRAKHARNGVAYQKYLERTIAKARERKAASSQSAERLASELKHQITGPEAAMHTVADVAVEAPLPQRPLDTVDSSDTELVQTPSSNDVTVRSPVEFLLAQVRHSRDVQVVYDHIDVIAALTEAQFATVYQSLKQILGSTLNSHHFHRAIKDVRRRDRCTTALGGNGDALPQIQNNDSHLHEHAADAVAALENANEPPVVFRRGGDLVVIQSDDDGRPIIKRMNEALMKGRLARVARFFIETREGPRKAYPPKDLCHDILTSGEGRFPSLGVLTQLPILRPDGTFRMEPGYDPVTRAYYRPTPESTFEPIPEHPGGNDVEIAVQHLKEAIAEFPFESPADTANCFALLLTPILRLAFRMNTPLVLIDAPKWGSGKTLLGLLVYTIITGGEGTVCAAPTSEDEWRKRMTSLLERGSAVVILDNIDQQLQSPSLSAVLTSPYWEDRVLGRSEDVRLPNVSTWIGTGNNIVLGGEIARRAIRIRLDAKVSNPAKRTGFRRNEQELLEWARQNRSMLVASLFILVRAWWNAGQPKAEVPSFGSFNKWAHKAGGILHHAGIEGFLENLDTVQVEADEESAQWEQFIRALALTFKHAEFLVAEIVDHAVHSRDLLGESFPDEIGHPDEHIEGGRASLVRRLGKALARKCGTRFGELELRLEKGELNSHTKVRRWRVAGNVDALFSPGDQRG